MMINVKVALIKTFLSLPKQSLFLKPPGVVILFYLDILTKLQFGTERQTRQCNDRTWI